MEYGVTSRMTKHCLMAVTRKTISYAASRADLPSCNIARNFIEYTTLWHNLNQEVILLLHAQVNIQNEISKNIAFLILFHQTRTMSIKFWCFSAGSIVVISTRAQGLFSYWENRINVTIILILRRLEWNPRYSLYFTAIVELWMIWVQCYFL